jgi:transcriptional regulator with XRE-family HTH domain
MEISIGKTIKKLRAEKSVTQEELAKYLNITFQSVSKWETEAATPDTMLLPQIAIFFGVSIDDLFSVGDINHFERVDKILEESGEELSESSFLYAKRYLVGLLEENPENAEALRRIIDLYKKRIDSYTEIAANYSERAITAAPDNRNLHTTFARLRGIQWDYEPIGWKLFRFYNERFIEKHPDNIYALKNLHDAYVQTNKYTEAVEILDKIKDEKTREILRGDMLIRLGKPDDAFIVLDKLAGSLSNDPNVLYEIGERYRRFVERRFNSEEYINYFEKAIQLFENSQKIYDSTMDKPYINSTYSRAFLYDNLGYYEKAIEMWEEIIMRDNRDFDGTASEWPRDMIETLKNKIAQRDQE